MDPQEIEPGCIAAQLVNAIIAVLFCVTTGHLDFRPGHVMHQLQRLFGRYRDAARTGLALDGEEVLRGIQMPDGVDDHQSFVMRSRRFVRLDGYGCLEFTEVKKC